MTKWDWILQDNLGDVFAKLNQLIDKGSNLDGDAIAYSIRRLINSEVKPGGPYRERDGKVRAASNKEIDRFLGQFNIELPSLKKYRVIPDAKANDSSKARSSFELQVIRNLLEDNRKDKSSLAKSIYDSLSKIIETKMSSEIMGISRSASEMVGARTRRSYLLKLAEANMYAWVAYSIYDDFFDDEGDVLKLPTANYCARMAFDVFNNVYKDSKSKGLVVNSFKLMDSANLFELNNCRAVIKNRRIIIKSLPNYGDYSYLANRAYAHILGPLLLVWNSSSLRRKEKEEIRNCLESFLIARQLNDDIHDWKEDLHNGHLSPVVTYLLKLCKYKIGTYDLENVSITLEKYFWDDGLIRVCNRTLKYTNNALSTIEKYSTRPGADSIYSTVRSLEAAMRASVRTHVNNKKFLEAYETLTTNSPE